MSELYKMITASVEVVGKNVVHFRPGGTYNLNEDNEIEKRIVNLRFLAMFAELAEAELSNNGECMSVMFGPQMERLGEEIFERYQPFIENGCNIFDHTNFYERPALVAYAQRPIVNQFMNAGPADRTPGLPDGWWTEFPGQCQKMFNEYFVVIDYDECVQIGIYQNNKSEIPIDMVFISTPGDFREVYKNYREHAAEITTVCDYCYEQYHI